MKLQPKVIVPLVLLCLAGALLHIVFWRESPGTGWRGIGTALMILGLTIARFLSQGGAILPSRRPLSVFNGLAALVLGVLVLRFCLPLVGNYYREMVRLSYGDTDD